MFSYLCRGDSYNYLSGSTDLAKCDGLRDANPSSWEVEAGEPLPPKVEVQGHSSEILKILSWGKSKTKTLQLWNPEIALKAAVQEWGSSEPARNQLGKVLPSIFLKTINIFIPVVIFGQPDGSKLNVALRNTCFWDCGLVFFLPWIYTAGCYPSQPNASQYKFLHLCLFLNMLLSQ